MPNGPAMTAVEQIAHFTEEANAALLTAELRSLYKRNILDSLGCAIAALPGKPFGLIRGHFADYRAPGRCTLIGGGQAAPDQAAFYNTSLVRYVDLLDSYMSPGGLCHPADNFGGVLAAAEAVGASGEDFMLALAIAYELACRFTAAVPVMAKGFNHALQLAISVAAASGKLKGASAAEIAHAIAIAAADNVSLAAVHSEPVSQWKGFSPGITAMRAVGVADLAKRGFTGPLRLFEGPNGLERMFGQEIWIDWSGRSLGAVRQTVMKKFCCLIHGQPVLEAVLDLKRANAIAAPDVVAVLCETFQSGFDIAGGGSFGPKDHPATKEQADYNLKYLIAAALLDGQVGPAQLEEERIRAADAQALLAKVEVRPTEEFTRRYPHDLDCRITIRLAGGASFAKTQRGYEGGLANPLTWARTLQKFHWLAEPYAGAALREEIVGAVEHLDERPLSTLLDLLGQVHREASYPARLPSFQ